ncbi:MAG: hypothetical protein AAGL97_06980 [Pseudomonadota bacterium]
MTYFENFVETAFPLKCEKCREALSALTSQLAAEGQLLSGRRWVQTETILLEQTTAYAEHLIQKLMEFEAEHSPIRTNDLETAISTLSKFRQFCEDVYEDKRTAGKGAYPESRRPFDGRRMETVFEEARQNILG